MPTQPFGPGTPGEPRLGLRRRTLWYVAVEQAEGQRRYTLEGEALSVFGE